MNCVDVSENQINAVDNRLNGYDRISFFEHIDHCLSCKHEYESQLLIKKLLTEKTQHKEVPQELLNFLRTIPNHSQSNSTDNRNSHMDDSNEIRHHKINILVWGLVTSAAIAASAFYIMNLK